MINLISNAYNIDVLEIGSAPSGWSAEGYRVITAERDYYLKVFDKHRHTAQQWIKRIDNYIPIVLWMYDNTPFRDELIPPVFTIDGCYKFETDDNIFILYPYITGTTPADKPLTADQQHDLAEIVAKLHLCGQAIPAAMFDDVEKFDIPFYDNLTDLIKLETVLSPYTSLLTDRLEKLKSSANQLADSDLNYVVCHTDIHGWNLIQSEKLYLMDWEGLKLAPAEADLFAFTDGFFFDYMYDTLMNIYQSMRPDYIINQTVMEFYRLRRRLEDITEFANGILYDNISDEEIAKSINHIIKECSFL